MIKISVFGDFRAKEASKIVVDEEVKKIIKASDFAICNYEAPVAGGG